jgi:hypothetical protein
MEGYNPEDFAFAAFLALILLGTYLYARIFEKQRKRRRKRYDAKDHRESRAEIIGESSLPHNKSP